MSVTRLPSGHWRAQIYDPETRTNVSVSRILGGRGTFRTKTLEELDAVIAAMPDHLQDKDLWVRSCAC